MTLPVTPNDMIIREALVSDHDDILNIITKDENLYDGRDYLPYLLQDWLEDGSDQNSNRRNLVFLLKDDNQIVGFRSIYFQSGGTVAAFFARRIRKDLRGKGLGRRLLELTVEYLKSKFPLVTDSLVSIGNHDLPDSEFVNNSRNGKLLTRRSCTSYEVTLNAFKEQLIKYAQPLPMQQLDDGENNHFKFLTKDQYKQVLRNKHFVSEALENDTILLNWVPVLIKTEGDYECAAMNSQYIFCLLYTSSSPPDLSTYRMPSSA